MLNKDIEVFLIGRCHLPTGITYPYLIILTGQPLLNSLHPVLNFYLPRLSLAYQTLQWVSGPTISPFGCETFNHSPRHAYCAYHRSLVPAHLHNYCVILVHSVGSHSWVAPTITHSGPTLVPNNMARVCHCLHHTAAWLLAFGSHIHYLKLSWLHHHPCSNLLTKITNLASISLEHFQTP